MGVRFLVSKATGVGNNFSGRFLHSQLNFPYPSPGGPSIFQRLKSLHSLVRGDDYSRSSLIFSRYFFSGSIPRAERADSPEVSALSIDDRVPATIITGFLGSGKVVSFFILQS